MPAGQTWLVTGASGYVGSKIAEWAERNGATVVRAGRAGPARLVLPDEIPRDAVASADVLVHAAYDFGPRDPASARRVNVDGSRALLECAASHEVRAIVLSSLSAFPAARSLYGQTKMAIEAVAASSGASVVRPGLVWGADPGGMYGALVQAARLPVVPLPGGGRQEQHLVHYDDLAAVIAAMVARPSSEPMSVAHPTATTIRQIVAAGRPRGRRQIALSVPMWMTYAGLRLAEAARVTSRLRVDGLVALEHPNPQLRLGQSPLGVPLRPFRLPG